MSLGMRVRVTEVDDAKPRGIDPVRDPGRRDEDAREKGWPVE
jgi:hypothetical protein